jgi:AI-2 transport protein TqsA
VAQLSASVTLYQTKAVELLGIVTDRLPLERFGMEVSAVHDSLRRFSMGTLGDLLLGTTNAVREILSQGALVMIFMVFLLLGTGGEPAPAGSTWSQIETRTKRYLVTKGALSAATGALVWAVLSLLGIDLALVFGLFAFLLNFIPSIGSIIATLLPLPVVIVTPDIELSTAILAIAVPGGIQFAIGNLLEPKIMGDSFGLHPVAILLNLMIWGMLWGIVGMLLATPLLVMIKILCERAEQTRPIAALIAGRIQGINA